MTATEELTYLKAKIKRLAQWAAVADRRATVHAERCDRPPGVECATCARTRAIAQVLAGVVLSLKSDLPPDAI